MTFSQLEAIRSRNFLLDPSSSLSYLLPPCLILLAIDVAVRLSHRKVPTTVPPEDEVDLPRYNGKVIDRLSHRAHKVLSDFSRLEANISAELMHSQRLCRTLEKRRNFARHRHRLEAHNARCSSQGIKTSSYTERQSEGVSKSFETFCQRLLLQNKIWSQQKQIKALRGSLDSAQSTNSSSAFKGLCERLLVSNRIWKLQEEVKRLMEEAEQLKRSRVAAVTRAAKQMVQDVRKERLTEEFVKDLLVEMDGHRRAIGMLKSEHEKEMAEVAEGWKGDYQRLCKEIERLQLAQDARLMEQELSNEIESDLLERLILQEQKHNATRLEERMVEDDSATLSGDSDVSMSTVVGSVGQCSPNKFAFDDVSPKSRTVVELSPLQLPRRRRISLASVESARSLVKTPIRRLDPEPYVGFSFNPLFFGTPNISWQDGTLKVESPTNVVDLNLRSLSRPTRARPESTNAPAATEAKGPPVSLKEKAPWRI